MRLWGTGSLGSLYSLTTAPGHSSVIEANLKDKFFSKKILDRARWVAIKLFSNSLDHIHSGSFMKFKSQFQLYKSQLCKLELYVNSNRWDRSHSGRDRKWVTCDWPRLYVASEQNKAPWNCG